MVKTLPAPIAQTGSSVVGSRSAFALPFLWPMRRVMWRGLRALRALRGPLDPKSADPPPADVLLLPHAGWPGLSRPAIERAQRVGTALIAICWDILPLTRPDLFSLPQRVAFESAFSWLLPRLDTLIAGSAATRCEIQAWADRRGIDLPALEVVWPVVDVPSPSDTLRPRLGLAIEAPVVLLVGSFVPRKNHLLCLAVMERLWASGSTAILLCIGPKQPSGNSILNRLQAHPENGRRLRLVHDASDAEVSEAYHFARAALMPSEAEGFGIPIAEAALCGCPILCSDIPVFREFAGDFATFVPCGNVEAWTKALTSALEDELPRAGLTDSRDALRERFQRRPANDVLRIAAETAVRVGGLSTKLRTFCATAF